MSWTVCIRTDFAASHIIEGHQGKCARLHGHNWKVEVEAIAHALDNIGVGIDFSDLKAATNKVVNELDHYHLNDLPCFAGKSPTAEVVAQHLYHAFAAELAHFPHVTLTAITLFENDRCSVKYVPT